jgi:hypothetical protein
MTAPQTCPVEWCEVAHEPDDIHGTHKKVVLHSSGLLGGDTVILTLRQDRVREGCEPPAPYIRLFWIGRDDASNVAYLHPSPTQARMLAALTCVGLADALRTAADELDLITGTAS